MSGMDPALKSLMASLAVVLALIGAITLAIMALRGVRARWGQLFYVVAGFVLAFGFIALLASFRYGPVKYGLLTVGVCLLVGAALIVGGWWSGKRSR